MPAARPRVLIADDEADVRASLALLLEPAGYTVVEAASPAEARVQLAKASFALLLADLNYTRGATEGTEGLDLVRHCQANHPGTAVVVLTAWGTIDLAVSAMRAGAADFLTKPWENTRLLTTVRNQVTLVTRERAMARREAADAAQADQLAAGFIARSPAMEPVRELIARIGPSEANVLITGENGTGKGLVARLLHAASPRATGPFVTVDLGSVTPALFASELFGHRKGAFTDARQDRVGRFAMASGGSLFLDELANVPTPGQNMLLGAVETGQFTPVGGNHPEEADVRLLSATNADLHAAVIAGTFRQDLLYRLNTIVIDLPPLRARREDIAPLAAHFLAQLGQRYHRMDLRLAPAAQRLLEAHPWPGNVRELAHALERAVLMSPHDELPASAFALEGTLAPPAPAPGGVRPLDEVEADALRGALAAYPHHALAAAEALGLSKSAFYRRLERHGIPPPTRV